MDQATVMVAEDSPDSRAIFCERVISTNQFKNGTHIEVDGKIFRIVEFQHVKPGKGGAFVRTKLKRAADGAVIDKTFRAGEKVPARAHRVAQDEFLYSDGSEAPLHGQPDLRADRPFPRTQ